MLPGCEGVAFCEAHEDLEVFRLRLGRALNFEYMEDSQVSTVAHAKINLRFMTIIF